MLRWSPVRSGLSDGLHYRGLVSRALPVMRELKHEVLMSLEGAKLRFPHLYRGHQNTSAKGGDAASVLNWPGAQGSAPSTP